ncbi:hypothetical protein BaRGS_00039220 [Batillaria attramentaria]|uniref:Uncharacterized protein n=1 Tax=Batillaria attramentaria TaxID=370345 RepID=A0ABD0J4L7_9CAEN
MYIQVQPVLCCEKLCWAFKLQQILADFPNRLARKCALWRGLWLYCHSVDETCSVLGRLMNVQPAWLNCKRPTYGRLSDKLFYLQTAQASIRCECDGSGQFIDRD